MPVLAKDTDRRGIEVGVNRGLRKTEIDIGPFALRNKRGGDQMKAFVPDKRSRLGVGNQGSGRKKKGSQKEFQGKFLPHYGGGRGVVLSISDYRLI